MKEETSADIEKLIVKQEKLLYIKNKKFEKTSKDIIKKFDSYNQLVNEINDIKEKMFFLIKEKIKKEIMERG